MPGGILTDGFMGLSPYDPTFHERMDEMERNSSQFKELLESIEGKLLEVEEVQQQKVARVGRIHLARITDVDHSPDPESPPKYKALSIDTWDSPPAGQITVPQDPAAYAGMGGHVVPLTRPVTSPPFGLEDADVTGGPAGEGELCFIVIDVTIPVPPDLPQPMHGLMLWEEAKTTLCPSDPSGGGPLPLPSMDGPGTVGELIRDVMDEQRRSWP